jgi:hypothetical protein
LHKLLCMNSDPRDKMNDLIELIFRHNEEDFEKIADHIECAKDGTQLESSYHQKKFYLRRNFVSTFQREFRKSNSVSDNQKIHLLKKQDTDPILV